MKTAFVMQQWKRLAKEKILTLLSSLDPMGDSLFLESSMLRTTALVLPELVTAGSLQHYPNDNPSLALAEYRPIDPCIHCS
jgi:hypothetical protein